MDAKAKPVALRIYLRRQQACAVCAARCQGLSAGQSRWLRSPESECALSQWPEQPAKPTPPTIGLGDVVAALAQPIAGAIDAVAGTDIEHCGGCAKRRAALNRIVPDISNPFGREKQPLTPGADS